MVNHELWTDGETNPAHDWFLKRAYVFLHFTKIAFFKSLYLRNRWSYKNGTQEEVVGNRLGTLKKICTEKKSWMIFFYLQNKSKKSNKKNIYPLIFFLTIFILKLFLKPTFWWRFGDRELKTEYVTAKTIFRYKKTSCSSRYNSQTFNRTKMVPKKKL